MKQDSHTIMKLQDTRYSLSERDKIKIRTKYNRTMSEKRRLPGEVNSSPRANFWRDLSKKTINVHCPLGTSDAIVARTD